jgi:hypothetical protein
MKTAPIRDFFFEGLRENREAYLSWRRQTGRGIEPIDGVPENFQTAERCFRDLSEADRLALLNRAPRDTA